MATIRSSRPRTRTRVAVAKAKVKSAARGALVGARTTARREKAKLRRVRTRTRLGGTGRVSRDARTTLI
jgi:hypothetical protein